MFTGGPSFTARLANIQHMPVLIAATVASEKPIDAYLLKEITRMSFESSQTRAFLHQYLLNQLVTSKNVYVKWKILKIIEELLQKGHIEFKQNLRKQPEPLNEASRLRANHTKDGGIMTECARIRDLSNKLLEMLYEDTPEMQQKRYPDPEFRSSSASSSSRMEGFGNTSYVSSKAKPSSNASDKLKALFGSSTKSPSSPLVYDQNYATMDPVPHNMHAGSVGRAGYSTAVSHASGRYLEHGVPEGAPHRSGQAGGGWGTKSSPPSQPPPLVSEQTVREQYDHINTAKVHEDINTERERKLVDDITAPGGIKSAPPRDSLNQFLSRCKVLDCLAVVDFLRQKLQDEQSQVVLRTLFVVEALLKSDIPDIFSYLDLVLEELSSLSQSNNTSIKAKAKKILHQLEADDGQQRAAFSKPGSEAGSSEMGTVPGGGTGTILDLGEDGGRERELGQQEDGREEHTEEPSSAGMQGLFAGMSLSSQLPSGSSNSPTTTARSPRTHQKKMTSPQVARRQPEAEREAYGDLIGLTSSGMTPSPNHQAASAAVTEGRRAGEEMSLMDIGAEEKDDFDPLMRTEAKSNPLPQNSSQVSVPTATPSAADSDGIMSQLSGLDLSLTTQTDTSVTMQNGIGTGTSGILHPSSLHPSLLPPPSTSHTLSSSGPTPLLTTSRQVGVVMGGAMGSNYGTQMPTGLVYVPTRAALPYAVQSAGPQGVPMYSTAPGPSIMYMNQPRLGGDARPVQRPVASDGTAAAESSFDFLGKSSKGSAFDFVKEEIDSAKKK